jgi:hypothetical protein
MLSTKCAMVILLDIKKAQAVKHWAVGLNVSVL